MKAVVAFLLSAAYVSNGQQPQYPPGYLPHGTPQPPAGFQPFAPGAPGSPQQPQATQTPIQTVPPPQANPGAPGVTPGSPAAPGPGQPVLPPRPVRPAPQPPIVPMDSGDFSCAPPNGPCAHRVVEVTPSQGWSMTCPSMGSCIGTTVNINVGYDPANVGLMVTRLGAITCGAPSSCAGMTINIKNTLGIWAPEPVQLNDLRCEVHGACNGLKIFAGPGVDIFTANFDCQQPGSCIACMVQDAVKMESCDANQNPAGAMLMPHQAPPLPPVPGMPQMPVQGPYTAPSWIYSGNPADPQMPLMPGQAYQPPQGHQAQPQYTPIQPIQPQPQQRQMYDPQAPAQIYQAYSPQPAQPVKPAYNPLGDWYSQLQYNQPQQYQPGQQYNPHVHQPLYAP